MPATPLVGTSTFYKTVRVTDRAAILPAPPEVDTYIVYNTVRVLIQGGHLVRDAIGGHLRLLQNSQAVEDRAAILPAMP